MNDEQILNLLKEGKLSLRDLLYTIYMRETKTHPAQPWFNEYQLRIVSKAFELIDSNNKSKPQN